MKKLKALEHSVQQSHYQLMIGQRLALRLGLPNLGVIMKIKRHARNLILTICVCIAVVDSAYAVGLETRGGISRATASIVEGRHILHYPQVVDNSSNRLIKENKHLWITHAEQIVSIYWNKKQIKAFKTIIYLESRWNPNAYNPATNAYGLGQIIDSKRYTKDMPYKQITAAVKYILHRYGTPMKALQHHRKHGWY